MRFAPSLLALTLALAGAGLANGAGLRSKALTALEAFTSGARATHERCLSVSIPTGSAITSVDVSLRGEYQEALGTPACQPTARSFTFELNAGVSALGIKVRCGSANSIEFRNLPADPIPPIHPSAPDPPSPLLPRQGALSGRATLQSRDARSTKDMMVAFGQAVVNYWLGRTPKDQLTNLAATSSQVLTAALDKFAAQFKEQTDMEDGTPVGFMKSMEMARVHVARDFSAWMKDNVYTKILGIGANSGDIHQLPKQIRGDQNLPPISVDEVKATLAHATKRMIRKLTELVLLHFYGVKPGALLDRLDTFTCDLAAETVTVNRPTEAEVPFVDPLIRDSVGRYSATSSSPRKLPGKVLCLMSEWAPHSIFTQDRFADGTDGEEKVRRR